MVGSIDVRRAGFAAGGATALFYVGCVLVMFAVPRETVVQFFNGIMHGVDVAPIMRWEMPWWEPIMGTVEIFVLGWLFGALVAVLYNLGLPARGG